MFGVLVDVSGSMESTYAVDRSNDTSVERTHAIFTAILNIVKGKVDHEESIFACAFGLNGDIETCDLFFLLESIRDLMVSQVIDRQYQGHKTLIDLAIRHGAQHAVRWIERHLSESDARILLKCFCRDRSLIQKLIQLIPSKTKTEWAETAAKASMNLNASTWTARLLDTLPTFLRPRGPTVKDLEEQSEAELVHRSEAYIFARELVRSYVEPEPHIVEQLKPRPVQDVLKMLDDLLLSKESLSAIASPHASSSSTLHDQIGELFEPIKPCIFGGTPMCKALKDAAAVFYATNAKPRILFLLSDGDSADGDPLPIAQILRDMGVTIVTCFLTSDHIDNPRRLLVEADPNWRKSGDGRSVLFEMSSTVNQSITDLIAIANWELPPTGVARLFLQANTLELVNEFCEKIVSQMSEPQ